MAAGQPSQKPNASGGAQARIDARLASLRPALRVAGFELVHPLQARRPAAIWKAVDPNGFHVAIKFGRKPATKHPAIPLADAFDHPHVARPLGSGESGGTPFIVLPYLEGGCLKEAVPPGKRCSPHRAAAIVQKLAWALGFAHRDGFAHGRVRPEHVLIDKASGEPLLIGLPSIVGDGECERDERIICPAMRYWPPERFAELTARSRPAPNDPADDQWALGVMLYEMLTGKKPFEGATLKELSQSVLLGEPQGEFPKSVPTDLKEICLRCLAKSPEDRFPHCGELARVLEVFLSGEKDRRVAEEDEIRHRAVMERVEKKGRREFWKLALWLLLVSSIVGVIVAIQLAGDSRSGAGR